MPLRPLEAHFIKKIDSSLTFTNAFSIALMDTLVPADIDMGAAMIYASAVPFPWL